MSILRIEIKIIVLILLLLSFIGCNNKKPYQNQNILLSRRMCPGLIAFVSQGNRSDVDRAIYTMNGDGSNQKNLTPNTVFSNHPVWSPDGKSIAFQALANIADFKNQIFVMNADGSNLKNLSKSETSDSLPLWSPNGQYIAFTRSFVSDNKSDEIIQNNIKCSKLGVKYNIYVMKSDGSNQKNLGKMRDEQMLSVPIGWSQDSKRVFFHAFKLCDSQTVAYLSAVDIDTLNETVITELPQYGRYTAKISLSPNGQKIAFEFSNSQDNQQIHIINTDGSNRRQLTQNAQINEYPSWSPDNKRLAFSKRNKRLDFYSNRQVLSLLNVTDGLGEIRLINQASPPQSYSMEKSSFIWSPDGKQILFRWSNNPDSIYVFNVDNSTYKKLTNGEQFIANPRWQPVPCN